MIPRFILRNIAVVNFYLYAQDFPTSGQGNAVFLGSNGSGKSVLLDAIQIVMTGMNRRYLDLNSRVSEGGKGTRTVREACLGLLDDGQGYERNECQTYIALGFETADGSHRCTAGVCLEAKASLSEENVLGLFIAEDVILRFDDLVHLRQDGFEEKAWQNFLDEQRRKQRAVHLFTRQNNRAFLRHLYSIINGNTRGTQLDPDRARAAMSQALSFDIDEIKSVTDFVKKFLLDDLPIEIETFQARYTTWRQMQRQIADVEAEIRQVEVIRALTARVLEDQFNARMWNYAVHRAEYDRYGDVIARQKLEIEKMEEELRSTQSYLTRLGDDVEYTRQRLNAIEEQVNGTPASKQLRAAEAQKERHDAVRRTGNFEAKPIFNALKAVREAVLGSSFPQEKFPALAEFTRRQLSTQVVGDYDADWPKVPKMVTAAIAGMPDLESAQVHVEALHGRISDEKTVLVRERDETERLLKNLRGGGSYMSKDTQDFLADLRRLDISAHTLSEVADIDPSFAQWRGIIESILGDWVDAVIVAPPQMDRAYSHFDGHYKATRAKLIQTENVSAQDEHIRPGTLAEAVKTDDKYARAFLNVRLGRIVRARSAQDIRRGDLAASEDGKYAHGRGIEYRRLQQIPRLGKSVRDQQIAQLTERERKIKDKLQPVVEEEGRLLAMVRALQEAARMLVSGRSEALRVIENIEAADAESKRQAELIADLEALLPQGIVEEKRDAETLLATYRKELREETQKEHALIETLGSRREALRGNTNSRKDAGLQARGIFPPFERRRCRHDPPIGLENFVGLVRAAYRTQSATLGHPAQVRNHFDALLKEKRLSHRSTVSKLLLAVQDYVQAKPDQHPGLEWTEIVEAERTELYGWIVLRHRHLTETALRNFKTQVDKAVLALVETMVHDFLSRLRANIDSVERSKDDLNRALRGSVFMDEVYQIRQERDQDKETVRYLIDRLDIIAPKATALMQSDADPNDPDQVRIKELIEMLTMEKDDDPVHRRRVRDLADYRNYFRFSIDICDPLHGYKKISDLEQRRGKASGGQKFVPFYICLGVAAASAYLNHLGGTKDAPPQSALLLMDEAFEKLDPDNIYKIIQFYDRLGLQLIMAAPKTHLALYQETFDTLVSIIRSGRGIQATPQHFHAPARELLHSENPMHQPRSYFEERVRLVRSDAAE